MGTIACQSCLVYLRVEHSRHGPLRRRVGGRHMVCMTCQPLAKLHSPRGCSTLRLISHEGVMSWPFLWLGLFVVHYSGDETRNDKQNGNWIWNESFWVYYDPPLTFELSSLWALGVWTCREQVWSTCVLGQLVSSVWCGG